MRLLLMLMPAWRRTEQNGSILQFTLTTYQWPISLSSKSLPSRVGLRLWMTQLILGIMWVSDVLNFLSLFILMHSFSMHWSTHNRIISLQELFTVLGLHMDQDPETSWSVFQDTWRKVCVFFNLLLSSYPTCMFFLNQKHLFSQIFSN